VTPLVERILAIDAALDDAGIPHAFGGALALAYAVADPRGTRDIDVNLFVPEGEAGRALEALPSAVEVEVGDIARAERDGQVRVHWGEYPVDLFFDVHRFHQLASRRVRRVPLAGRRIPVLDATDLTVFKVLFDRTKDWADLEAMLEVSSFDADEVARWLDELVGPDDQRTVRFRALIARGPSDSSEPRSFPLRPPT